MTWKQRLERRLKRIKGGFGPRICEVDGCWNSTASERTWYCVDHWPVEGRKP